MGGKVRKAAVREDSMNHCKLIVTALALIGVLHTGNARAEIKTEVVEYNQGDTALEGFLAYDDAVQGKRPAILVAHTWTGVSDFIRTRSTELAKMGYVVFAPDIYGKGVRPKPPVETRQEMGKYTGNRPLLRSRVQAGLDVLRANPMTDTGKVLAIGFCFGGTTVLELARTGADVLGVVSFHGGPLDSPTPDDARNIKGRVLVLHGADDPNVPASQVTAFEKEMRDAKVDWQLVAYGNTVHSFTDPAAGNDNFKGAAYNEKADKRSWIAMQDFFKEILSR
jgi:dienelactone hydrolase